MHRRDVVKLVPLAILGSVTVGFTRLLAACSEDPPVPARDRATAPAPSNGIPQNVTPTDADEFVPGGNAQPAIAGEGVPQVPNAAWESRGKQLDAEQLRLWGVAVFTQAAPDRFLGKERSHVPKATLAVENNLKKVTVLVEHVMGKNALDAGPIVDSGIKPDASPDASPVIDASTGADAGASDAADATTDAIATVDASPPVDASPADAGPVVKPPEHYITTVFLRGLVDGKETILGLWEFASTDAAPPSVKFTLPASATQVTAYEWCTLHGLWKSDPLTV